MEQNIIIMITKFSGNIVDVFRKEIFSGTIFVEDKRILRIERSNTGNSGGYILPGFVDSHIHIESSMLTPQNFADIAITHGTVGVVSDPHEIANVLGLDGVKYMLENAALSKLKFCFGAPSCVPATPFEKSGGEISADDIEYLFKEEGLHFLSEVMNFPGVISGDKLVIDKISIAKKYKKRIDGHAPGLRGIKLNKYISEGIETDHESYTYDEAREKIQKGMKIQIRQGSAAKNFKELARLIDEYPEDVFLCTDDLHPDDLLDGHINRLITLGLEMNVNLFNLLRAVTINPVQHYGLDIGLLRANDPADFIVVEDLEKFSILKTVINGELVFEKGNKPEINISKSAPNRFTTKLLFPEQLKVPDHSRTVRVIEAINGELLTRSSYAVLSVADGSLQTDINIDVLKIVILNRYTNQPPAVAFIRNFGLKKGAIASSVSHDSHNIIAVGVNDKDITDCMNWIIERKGGISVSTGDAISGLNLPVAGIMSVEPCLKVSEQYKKLKAITKTLGCTLDEPFMTLSFMGLLVIPELKMSYKGLFDVEKFNFTSLYK